MLNHGTDFSVSYFFSQHSVFKIYTNCCGCIHGICGFLLEVCMASHTLPAFLMHPPGTDRQVCPTPPPLLKLGCNE